MPLEWTDILLLIILFFISYVSSLHLILWAENRKKIFKKGSAVSNFPSVSIVIPAYNEEKTIKRVLGNVLSLNYPKENVETIVVDDGSSDGTYEEASSVSDRIKVFRKQHSGKAASINFGIRKAKNNFVAVVDGDSFLTASSLSNAMKYFDRGDVAGVTTRVLVKKRETIFERWQDIEFKVIALTRKIRESLNLVDVTPGPLSIYRKDVLKKVGLFDEKNLTEDIEIAWRLLDRGYRINMAYDSVVYTYYPEKFSTWLRQRVRWQIGWMQTLKKYSSSIFRNHPVGTFMFPLGLLSLIFQTVGVGLFFYLLGSWVLTSFYYLNYSYALGSAPNILNIQFFPNLYVFYGMILFLFGTLFSIYTLKLYKGRPRFLDFVSFLVVYIYLFIPVTIYSFVKLMSPANSWLTK